MRPAGAELSARSRAALLAGRAVGQLSRVIGAGDGTVIGGKVSLALQPGLLRDLALGREFALVSGTNGKTTTTKLLSAALGAAGPVVSNRGGSNMPAGLVSALNGCPPGVRAALEVDEGWLPSVAGSVSPAVIVLLNLSRDQLDRTSEVRMVGRRWRSCLEGMEVHVVANCDDPIVAWAAGASESVTWVAAGQPWRADAAGCPRCEGRISFAAAGWVCPRCGLARPEPAMWLEEAAPDGVATAGWHGTLASADGRRISFRLHLPGRFNQANAAMAAAAAESLGVPEEAALKAMSATAEVGGRYQVVRAGRSQARLLLAKNPAGWVGIFDLLEPSLAPVVVAINARVADGRDPSWLWDVEFERLAGRFVVATGERRADLAVRLSYAGVEHATVENQVEALAVGAEHAPAGSLFDYVGNYTSFQSLRRAVEGAAAAAGGSPAPPAGAGGGGKGGLPGEESAG